MHWSVLLNSWGGPSADLWDSLWCYLVSSVLWTLAILFSQTQQLQLFNLGTLLGLLQPPFPIPWPLYSLKVISWGTPCLFPISEASFSFIAWYSVSLKPLFYIFCLAPFSCCCWFRWEGKYGPCCSTLLRSSPKALLLIVTSKKKFM